MTRHSAPSAAVPIPLPMDRDGASFDPPPLLAHLREEQPLRRLAYPDGHVGWLVTSDDLARKLLLESRLSHRTELVRPPVPWPAGAALYGRPTPSGMFLHLDPPEHTRFRKLLAGQFNMHRLEALTPRIAEIVEQHLDAIERSGPPADLVEQFALPVPSLVICELLGVPYEDRADWHHHNMVITSLETTTEQGETAWQALDDYLHRLVREKRSRPDDGLLSALAAGSDLNDDELAGVGLLLHRAGHETTANMLALGTFALLTHPDQLETLRDDPAGRIDDAVEELLRFLTILQFGVFRTAVEDIEVGDVTIAAGETVTVSLPAANRDPARFARPDALDLGREANRHLAFGRGIHACVGQQLARVEMRIGYAALLRRFPGLRLAVPAEEVPLRHDMGFYGVDRLPVAW